MGILANENAISAGGYQISNSLRFQAASSTYMSRTPGSAGNRQTWTYSTWIKLGSLSLGTQQFLLNAGPASDNERTQFTIDSNLAIGFVQVNGGSVVQNLNTTQVFRDPSAWYHIVLAVDTTQATASNRAKLYINGSQVTAFSTATYMAQNTNTYINNTTPHYIGKYENGSGNPSDWYQAESILVDGQALTPSSFGTTDPTSGQWVAKKYTGTYGTNGFYLPFSNGTSTTTLGSDSSGNGNNWTLTNFTRSAGVSDCWMYDVPSGNGGAAGTQPNSNYCTLNPVSPIASGSITNSNLKFTSGNADCICVGTVGVSSGKWYWEVTATTVNGSSTYIGILGVPPASITVDLSVPSNGYGYRSTGDKGNNNSRVAYGASYTSGDVIGVALDMDAGTLVFYKNNASQGTAYSSLSGTFTPAVSDGSGASGGAVIDANFGQRSFSFTPPNGFKALCTANLPASTIVKGNQYMDATLYTGTGSTQSITNAGGFSPDLVWLKKRGGGVSAQWHMLADTIRGTGATLSSNATDAEYTGKTSVTAFNSNGFTLGADSTGASYYGWNIASDTYVGWQWDAGSSTVTNINGTISSQVRANPTSGVSVVTYTGTGANATVGHGLGVAPKMIIVKQRNGTGWWIVYHSNQAASPQAGYLALQTTNAYGADSTVWNNTAPTSSVFSIGTNGAVNTNTATYVAYCFAEIAGFSKFGSYTGNGSTDGSFVYTGFRPKYVMIKRTDTTGNWEIIDATRSAYNTSISVLSANTSSAEVNVSTYGIDILSNGFKLRAIDTTINGSGGTYIYMAFAENPFAQSNAR